MTKAGKNFENSIKDAEELLERFEEENQQSSKKYNSESLKRAGLILTLAAWETYVKDRFIEEIEVMLFPIKGSPLCEVVQKKIDSDLKQFFNPNAARTKLLFKSYFNIDITDSWKWDNYRPLDVRKKLDGLISLRGKAAHQAVTDKKNRHAVRKDELKKGIGFVKGLVEATEQFSVTVR
ncbi:HEPN domain-containing protein [Vibrio splendidus]|uniref:HEPN domain-containing protein n=1 Tax=Vibrio splendidus TaxID=29497 RepID=UPI003D0F3602